MYPIDQFIGSNLNFLNITINGYPLSFIIWNIFLALAAVGLGRITANIIRQRRALIVQVLAFLVWLIILPNAAYLMTDARHVIGYCPLDAYGKVCLENAWMSLFFFAYAALGWPTFIFALQPMKKLVSQRLGIYWSWLFTIVICFMSGLAVMIGLLQRFNSWQLVTDAKSVIQSSLLYVTEPAYLFNWLLATLILFCLYIIGERLFKV